MSSALASERVRELIERAGLGQLSPRALSGVVVTAVLIAALGVWRFWPAAPEPEIPFDDPPEEAAEEVLEQAGEVVVHVAGAVMRPGVYRLAPGSRVDDAVSIAGGALGNAALHSLNLARIVADGEQVYVPSADEAASGAPPPSGEGARGGAGSGQVNINRATAAELEALPGVGPATAQKIVDDREVNGPFRTPEDLMRVQGIGPKKFEAMQEFVTCG